MKHLLSFLLILFSVNFCVSQKHISKKRKNDTTNDTTNLRQQKSDKKKIKNQKVKATIQDYKIISIERDTTHLDTTLTIKKEYKYNYLRKDNFNYIQFANTGQTYNTLSFNSSSSNTLPLFGARARHFNYMELDDIKYYRVATPLTELYYKTVFEQGQNLDAFFTVNTSDQFNLSVAYKGLRSLGKYQNALTSTGNFRFTTNYKTKNERYQMRGHIVIQDALNQENGGLTDDDVLRFIEGDNQVRDRSVFDPNFEDAENNLEGKRFHLDHKYVLLKKQDSISNTTLSVNNIVSFEDKFYEYNQATANSTFFGNSFNNTISDKVTLEHFYTDLGLSFNNKTLGNIKFKINYNDINYGYNSLVILNDQDITNRIKTNFLGFQGEYKKEFKNFNFRGSISANLSDQIKGNFLDATITYKLSNDIKLQSGLNINSKSPNYNQLLYQSDYTNYNWDNQNNFQNINTQQIAFSLKSEKYFNAQFDVTNIDNYTYFNLEETINQVNVIKPIQYDQSIQYLRVKLQREFHLGKFSLDNTILYQNLSNDENVINVPSLVTRNTLYYSDEVFKKALKFQTGIIFNYFTAYNGNGYDPLLAEFYTQNQTKIGGFPRLDFFINAKVRQTRIYIKAEHFNASFTGNDYFSAPNHPYRDFTVRFGLVWNFFL